MSPFGPAVPEAAKQRMNEALGQIRAGEFAIFSGLLRDNTGRTVIPAGARLEQTAVELETMNYLVEGVVGQ